MFCFQEFRGNSFDCIVELSRIRHHVVMLDKRLRPERNEIKRGSVARIFQKGEGAVCQSEGTHQIGMSFSPPVVACLLQKSSQKVLGGGGTGTQNPPWLRP